MKKKKEVSLFSTSTSSAQIVVVLVLQFCGGGPVPAQDGGADPVEVRFLLRTVEVRFLLRTVEFCRTGLYRVINISALVSVLSPAPTTCQEHGWSARGPVSSSVLD